MVMASEVFAGRSGRVTVGSEEFDLSVVDLGELHVPSGRLGAADPFVTLDSPLVTLIPPGSYPSYVTVADVSDDLDGSHLREAYLSIRVRPGAAARVETGMPDGNYYQDLFEPSDGGGWFAIIDDAAHLRAGSANIPLPLADGKENVVLTHSGCGDGLYPVLATFDSDDNLLGVHIDLLVLSQDDEDDVAAEEPPSGSPRPGFFQRLFGR